MGLKEDSVKGVIWSSVEKFSFHSIHFIIGLILARLLTPSDFGLIGMLALFMAVSQIFIDGGFSTALIREKENSETDFSSVFYLNILISAFVYLIIFFSAPYISAFYGQDELTLITRIYSLNLVINSLAAVNKTKLIIDVDFKTQTKISVISTLVTGIIAIGFAFGGCGVWALVIQVILSSVLNVVLCIYYIRWKPLMVFSLSSIKRLFKFGSKLLIASLINAIYGNLYTLVIGKLFSKNILGNYTRADSFASFSGSSVTSILNRVSFPILSKLQDDDEKLIIAYRKYIKMSAFIVFPLVMIFCAIAKPMILLLLTEKWKDAILLLQIIAFSYLWDCIIQVNLNLLYVKGRSDLVLNLEVVRKTAGVIVLVVSYLLGGLIGVCLGRVFYAFFSFAITACYSKKALPIGFVNQFKDLAPYMFLSLTVTAVGVLISNMISNNLLSLITILLSFSVIYLTVSMILKLEAFSECMVILQSLKKR